MPADSELAASLVRDAGELAARMLSEGVSASYKTSISDVVTAADHAAEELVVARLRAARPDDGIVGEEGTSLSGARTWFVDPVDGTYNFLSGLPTWCAALALTDSEGPLLGAVYQPTSDELWLGGREIPFTRNGIAMPRLENRRLEDVSIASYMHPPRMTEDAVLATQLHVIKGAATLRVLGSGSVELAAVAAGRIGAWMQSDSLDWDWFPGVALVRAAGGAAEVVEAHGHRWHLAGSRQVVDEMAARVLSIQPV